MHIQTIRFDDESALATRELARRFDALFGAGHGALRRRIAALETLDRQYGAEASLPLEGVEEEVAAILRELSGLEAAELVIGVALWAMRHGAAIRPVEVVVNALAERSNRARGKQELAAAYGLMQALIGHVAPLLCADLERSDPERPWRILHANFAITAIRTEDPAMIAYAFDALDTALPDERAGFYAEALALALAPGVSPEVRRLIEERHRRWT